MFSNKWNLPEIDEPGFLKRKLEAIELAELDFSIENTKKVADYLSQYLKDEYDIYEDISEEEYNLVLGRLLGLIQIDPKK